MSSSHSFRKFVFISFSTLLLLSRFFSTRCRVFNVCVSDCFIIICTFHDVMTLTREDHVYTVFVLADLPYRIVNANTPFSTVAKKQLNEPEKRCEIIGDNFDLKCIKSASNSRKFIKVRSMTQASAGSLTLHATTRRAKFKVHVHAIAMSRENLNISRFFAEVACESAYAMARCDNISYQHRMCNFWSLRAALKKSYFVFLIVNEIKMPPDPLARDMKPVNPPQSDLQSTSATSFVTAYQPTKN